MVNDKRENHPQINLHMIGRLQTNKVKFAVSLFDYIHTVDNQKLVHYLKEEEFKQNKKLKYFIQVNIGQEPQKSGIFEKNIYSLVDECNKNPQLNLIGLMCIPPINSNTDVFFSKMNFLRKELNFKELSMGMSSDYINAIKHGSTFLRIGSAIFDTIKI